MTRLSDQSLCWFMVCWTAVISLWRVEVSQNRSFKSKWLWCDRPSDTFRNALCPQRLNSHHGMRCVICAWLGMWKGNRNTLVSGYLPRLVQEFRSSLPEEAFSKTESLPVTTEALERFFVSLKKWFSFSLLSRKGHRRLYLRLQASAGSAATVECACLEGCMRKVISWGQTHRCSFKLHLCT